VVGGAAGRGFEEARDRHVAANIDEHYGHLAPDAEQYEIGLLDAFDER
jgi:hypothetical protein